MPRVKKETTTEKRDTAKATGARKPKTDGLSIPVYSLEGRPAGTMTLSKELFGAKVNKSLLAQALRIYSNNQKTHRSHTKTRSEVRGSTRKIRAQKGTGGARHGSIKASIFVGGGIALGPKFRKTTLALPKKMRKAALIAALSDKMAEKGIIGISGLEKATGKTSQMATFIKNVNCGSTILVVDEKQDNAMRAVRNLPKFEMTTADQLNILSIIKYKTLILTKDAIQKLESRVKKIV